MIDMISFHLRRTSSGVPQRERDCWVEEELLLVHIVMKELQLLALIVLIKVCTTFNKNESIVFGTRDWLSWASFIALHYSNMRVGIIAYLELSEFGEGSQETFLYDSTILILIIMYSN